MPPAALEGVELVGRFLLPLLAPPTLGFTEELDSVCLVGLAGESDWSDTESAAEVAILALAAALGEGAGEGLEVSFRKNKLPEGRSLVSSLRLNRPSLGDVVSEVGVVSLTAAAEEEAESSPVGGECNLTKDSPYFSF